MGGVGVRRGAKWGGLESPSFVLRGVFAMALGNGESLVLHAAGWQPGAAAAGRAWAVHAPLVAAVLAAVCPVRCWWWAMAY